MEEIGDGYYNFETGFWTFADGFEQFVSGFRFFGAGKNSLWPGSGGLAAGFDRLRPGKMIWNRVLVLCRRIGRLSEVERTVPCALVR